MDEIKESLINDLKSFNGNLKSEDEYEGQVFKRAKGVCCFNRRYLIIRDGIITYYRDQPHSINFMKLNLAQSSGPKGQVSALICSIKLIPPSFLTRKSHKYIFQISFLPETRSSKNKRIIWIFSVRSEELLLKWKNAFDSAKLCAAQKETKRLEESKAIDDQVAEEQRNRALRDENMRKAKELEKQRAKTKQKEKLVEEEKRKNDIELEKKRIQEEAEMKKKLEEAKKRKENYERLLEDSWDYKFQKNWSMILENSQSFENSLEASLEMIKTIGIFLARAQKAVKHIVNQKVLPESEQQTPITSLDGISSYIMYDSLLINLTQKFSNNENWIRLGHELRANSAMFDLLHFAGKHEVPGFPFRVTLMCIVDFKGYRSLVTSLMPIAEERTLIHGPRSDGSFMVSSSLYEYLAIVADMMNLKEHVFEWNSKLGPVYTHLSYFVELHKTLGYKDLEDFVKESLGEEVDESSLDNIVYFQKLAELLPVDHSFIDEVPNFLNRLRPEFFQTYTEKLSSDCFVNKYPEAHKNDYEIIQASKSLQYDRVSKLVTELDSLDSIILDSANLSQIFHSFGVNLRYMSQVLDKTSIFYLKNLIRIEMLSRSCKLIFFQHLSETISEYSKFQEKQSEFSSAKRTLSILEPYSARRQSISSYSYTRRLSSLGMNKSQNFAQRHSEEVKSSEDFIDLKSENLLHECILDFYNLVFGNDEESLVFWEDILIPTCVSKFKTSAGGLSKHEVHLNALFFSLSYQCGIDINIGSESKFGLVAKPFASSRVVIKSKVKTLKFDSLECKVLAGKLNYFKNIGNLDSALQAVDLKLKMSMALSSDETALGDSDVLLEYGEILIEKGEIDKAIVKAKEALVQNHPLNAKSANYWSLLMKGLFLKDLNEEAMQTFDQALASVNFHWGPNHPLTCRLVNNLGDLYMKKLEFNEALGLYKYSLAICMKTIGPNHPFTAQINMKLGQVHQNSGNIEASAVFIEKSFLVFEAVYGDESIVAGKAAAQLAEVMVSLGRYGEGKKLVSMACSVYQKHLDRNEEVKNNLYEKSHMLNEFYLACLVGLVIGLKTNEFEMIKSFADKLWKIVCHSEEPDFMIVLQIIEYVLKAKFNLIGPKKSAKLNYFVNVRAQIDDDELETSKNSFLSIDFLSNVQHKGGIVNYIDRLVEKVVYYSEFNEQEKMENWVKIENSVTDLKAMMEINTHLL